MERILFLFPDFEELKKVASAYSISDEEIKKTIQARKWNQIWCPHTAIAVHVREQLAKEEHCIIAATAHPAKFETIVEPLIGESVLIPTSLDHLMRLPNRSKTIPNSYSELLNILA